MNSYAFLNQLKGASFLNVSANTWDDELLANLEEGSREIEKDTDRFFYIWEGIKYYDGATNRIILDDDVYSITSLDVDTDGSYQYASSYNLGSTSAQVDAFVYPFNITPITRLEANPQGNYGHFGSGFRKAIRITGRFGYGDDYPALPYNAIGDTVVDNPLAIGATSLTATNGNLFSAGMTLHIESEQLYVNANPTGNTIPIQRACNGTLAAAHVATTPIYLYSYPKAITKAVLIYAMRTWKRKESSYQNVVASPEMGSFTVWKGDDPDYMKAVKLYRKVRRGWYLN